MTKKEWQLHHNFTDLDMQCIEIAMNISDGRITEIMDKPLDYQDIKIKMKLC